MLTFTCPKCGTVTTIQAENKPYKPDMEYKVSAWRCGYCGTVNQAYRLTCNNCHRDKQGAVEVAG